MGRDWSDAADPGHAESARLHGDAAGLAGTDRAVADPHDGRVDAAQHRLDPSQPGDSIFLEALAG